ncbi:hypothetical protein DSO57_1013564 [Entomophthora muscae]|uniref:Uncharacterized protein n=1 Tax=Entomophthora muscae TaxID=34485 RepID=A0ACC2RKE4_9FUNG|nr:hypothetical protein DSO57_1013564 [Entomophthora muscae]
MDLYTCLPLSPPSYLYSSVVDQSSVGLQSTETPLRPSRKIMWDRGNFSSYFDAKARTFIQSLNQKHTSWWSSVPAAYYYLHGGKSVSGDKACYSFQRCTLVVTWDEDGFSAFQTYEPFAPYESYSILQDIGDISHTNVSTSIVYTYNGPNLVNVLFNEVSLAYKLPLAEKSYRNLFSMRSEWKVCNCLLDGFFEIVKSPLDRYF